MLAHAKARPLLYKYGGHFIFNFNRQALEGVAGVERHNPLSVLTKAQRDALDAVEAAARSVQFTLTAKAGDIAFANNFAILHARQAFRDSPSQTRHLIRMWLKNSDQAYNLPEELATLNERMFDESMMRVYNVLPKARLHFTFRERLGP